MNGQQIKKIKEDACKEFNKASFRYDMTDVSFDIESKDLVLPGLSSCLKDFNDREDSKLSDYELVITGLKIQILKK